MKKVKEYWVPVWFNQVWFEGIESTHLRTSDGRYEMRTSPVCRIEFKGHQAINGYTAEIETQNSVYVLKDIPQNVYFALMRACPEEFRGMDWCDIELATV